jgi:phosphoribosyl-AMP cyclohydrolase
MFQWFGVGRALAGYCYTLGRCNGTSIATNTILRWPSGEPCVFLVFFRNRPAARSGPFTFEAFVGDSLDFDKQGGLITAVVQHVRTGRVLMVGYMNREAFEKTLSTGHVTFFSRSRQKLWTKGETSGHFLELRSIQTDCDGDALLVTAEPVGPGVCHNGYESCFYRTLQNGDWTITEKQAYDSASIYSR